MRSLLFVVVAAAAAVGCKAEDPWAIHDPGHGSGSHIDAGGGGGDGGGIDASAGSISGQVCVVLQFDDPFACPNAGEAHGALVEVVDGGSTRSGNDGSFTIDAPTTTVTLRLGGETGDGLVTTDRIATAGSNVDAPAVDDVFWQQTLAAIPDIQTTGAMLIYVRDTAGAPVAGASVAYVSGGQPGARLYYDDGGGAWLLSPAEATTTGPDGIAMIVDTLSADLEASLGSRSQTQQVYTETDGIGLATITLPD